MNLLLSLNQKEGESDLLTVANKCPKCSSEHSLIILDEKMRNSGRVERNISLMKIQCIRCSWKFMRDFIWSIVK